MTPRRFRLAAVLRVRAIQEEQARLRLRQANAALAECEALAAAQLARYAAAGGWVSGPADAFGAERARADLAAATVADAARRRDRAAETVTRRRVEWQAAAQRLDALERLRARHAEGRARDLRRLDDAAADDLVTARAGRRERR